LSVNTRGHRPAAAAAEEEEDYDDAVFLMECIY